MVAHGSYDSSRYIIFPSSGRLILHATLSTILPTSNLAIAPFDDEEDDRSVVNQRLAWPIEQQSRSSQVTLLPLTKHSETGPCYNEYRPLLVLPVRKINLSAADRVNDLS